MSSHVYPATASDADAVGRLLHEFNREYGYPTPGAAAISRRVRELLGGDDLLVLLAGAGPDGVAVLRFRPSLWNDGLECYLAELYVLPERRGRGLGRALMDAAIDAARRRGADQMDLATSEDDVAARALYESLGFTSRERLPDGPFMCFYEREL